MGMEVASPQSELAFSVERILADHRPTKPDHPSPPPPAWTYCSRTSPRPTAGPRRRNPSSAPSEERRSRTAFNSHQVACLRAEFQRREYLSDVERQRLAEELGLTQTQIKIWFQNARAKRRKNQQSPLAEKLAEAGLYNHSVTKSP